MRPRPVVPSPVAAAELCTTGPSCLGSPARTTARVEPLARRIGTSVSGAVACPASSTKMCVNRRKPRVDAPFSSADASRVQSSMASARTPALAHDVTTTRARRAAAESGWTQNRTTSALTDASSRRGSLTRAIFRDQYFSPPRSCRRGSGEGASAAPAPTDASAADHSAMREQMTSAANAAGAHSNTRASGCVASTAVAAATTVIVFPVPGGPKTQYGGPLGAPRASRMDARPRSTSSTAASCSAFRRATIRGGVWIEGEDGIGVGIEGEDGIGVGIEGDAADPEDASDPTESPPFPSSPSFPSSRLFASSSSVLRAASSRACRGTSIARVAGSLDAAASATRCARNIARSCEKRT